MTPAHAPGPDAETRIAHGAASGIPWMILTKVLLLVVYFGISMLTVRGLGAEAYGVFSLCRNLAEYLVVLCALGLNAALLRFIPELVHHNNRAGLRRLLGRAALLQAGMVVLAGGALYLAAPWLGRGFKVDFRPFVLLTAGLVGAQLGKDFLNDSFTALFRSRTVSLLSAAQSALWLGLLAAGLAVAPVVSTALLAQIVSMGLLGAVGAALLVRHVRGMTGRSPPQGIGRARTLGLSVPTMLNSILRMMMLKYTEVFFLGAFFTPTVVGLYDLGYSTPQVVLTLIPAALQTLFTSAFAEAYTRDKTCLPRLIVAVYKLLILIIIPLSAFGVFFAPRAIVLLYGPEMQGAGPIASAFCILHVLPLISMPLSMAITAREQVLKMLPYMVLQVLLNLLLDWLLIPRWGGAGAVAAVALTFILTIPLRLGAVRRIVGGIYFPTGFLLRVGAVSAVLAGGLSLGFRSPTFLTLALASGAYLAAVVGSVRVLRLIRPGDLADVQRLGTGSLNRALAWLAGGRS